MILGPHLCIRYLCKRSTLLRKNLKNLFVLLIIAISIFYEISFPETKCFNQLTRYAVLFYYFVNPLPPRVPFIFPENIRKSAVFWYFQGDIKRKQGKVMGLFKNGPSEQNFTNFTNVFHKFHLVHSWILCPIYIYIHIYGIIIKSPF